VRHLEVTLAKPDSPDSQTKMHFSLLDLEIVSRLCESMEAANSENAPIRTTWGMYADSSKQSKLIDKLNYHIEEFNRLTRDDMEIPYRVDGDLTRDVLNKIHDQFDYYYYKIVAMSRNTSNGIDSGQNMDRPSGVPKHLHQINSHVHMLESIMDVDRYLQDGCVCAWYTMGFFRGFNYDYYKQPLQESDYDLFTLEESFGSVYLGYGRAGKCLFDIYESNDLAVLEKGYTARPAASVAAAFISLFGNYYKSHEDQLERFYDWWDRNNISQFGYKKHDKYNTLGRIKVGSLEPNQFIQHLYCSDTQCFDEVGVVKYYSDYSTVTGMQVIVD